MGLIIGSGGVNREIREMAVGSGGVNRSVKEGWIGSGGVNRLAFLPNVSDYVPIHESTVQFVDMSPNTIAQVNPFDQYVYVFVAYRTGYSQAHIEIRRKFDLRNAHSIAMHAYSEAMGAGAHDGSITCEININGQWLNNGTISYGGTGSSAIAICSHEPATNEYVLPQQYKTANSTILVGYHVDNDASVARLMYFYALYINGFLVVGK